MIKRVRLGDVFGGFDDAELIELIEFEETEEKKNVNNRGKQNDYKQNQV